MPAQAGIQTHLSSLGSRLRANNEMGFFRPSLDRFFWCVRWRTERYEVAGYNTQTIPKWTAG